jgi:hypothetical protein
MSVLPTASLIGTQRAGQVTVGSRMVPP